MEQIQEEPTGSLTRKQGYLCIIFQMQKLKVTSNFQKFQTKVSRKCV